MCVRCVCGVRCVGDVCEMCVWCVGDVCEMCVWCVVCGRCV